MQLAVFLYTSFAGAYHKSSSLLSAILVLHSCEHAVTAGASKDGKHFVHVFCFQKSSSHSWKTWHVELSGQEKGPLASGAVAGEEGRSGVKLMAAEVRVPYLPLGLLLERREGEGSN